MIFKAKKVMKFDEYLKIEKQLERGNIEISKVMISPAETTANRIEVILEIKLKEKSDGS